jgi:hypothetical protein
MTVRAAVLRRSSAASSATRRSSPPGRGLQPFFDDPEGTDAWRYGAGIDATFTADLHAGIEFSRRHTNVPIIDVTGEEPVVLRVDERDDFARAYLYWTPDRRLAVSLEYLYERLKRPDAPIEGGREVTTHRVPVASSVFDPSGFHARLQGTLVDQRGRSARGQWVPRRPRPVLRRRCPAGAGYRSDGVTSASRRVTSGREVPVPGDGPVTPQIAPGRLILGRLTLAF